METSLVAHDVENFVIQMLKCQSGSCGLPWDSVDNISAVRTFITKVSNVVACKLRNAVRDVAISTSSSSSASVPAVSVDLTSVPRDIDNESPDVEIVMPPVAPVVVYDVDDPTATTSVLRPPAPSHSIQGDVSSSASIIVDNSQFVEPRGRFKVTLSGRGILLDGKSASLFVPWTAVTHTVRVASFLCVKKDGEDMIAFKVDPAAGVGSSRVQSNGKDVKQLLWVLSNSPSKVMTNTSSISSTSTSVSGEVEARSEADVVSSFVQKYVANKIVRSDPSLFQSAATHKSFLRCYSGLQEGVLFPLRCGLVFMKPLVWVTSDSIAAISAGRGGSGSTRYVDLRIETTDDKVVEFTNIDREELASLQNYVKGYLEVKARQAAKKRSSVEAEGGQTIGDLNEDDDDDEDDEDFDPDASDTSDGDDSGCSSDQDEGKRGGHGSDNDSDSESDEDYVSAPKSKKKKEA